MIIANPDDQVWKLLTGGVGTSAAREELEKLKAILKEHHIFFVADHDDRYHWIRLRSRRDLQIIQVKADIMAESSDSLLKIRYAGQVNGGLHAEEAWQLLRQYYQPDEKTDLQEES